MRSGASDPDGYLAELPPDRAETLGRVRETILANLPDGFVELMDFGMVTYAVPLERYPDTYNGHPLMLAGLASQKRHLAVYLMVEGADEEWFRARYAESPPGRAGRRLDMGKSCLRFSRLEDVPLDLVGETVARYDVDQWIERYESSRS